MLGTKNTTFEEIDMVPALAELNLLGKMGTNQIITQLYKLW